MPNQTLSRRKLTASVARTADGRKHLNTLVVPGYGITDLYLQAVKGGARSNSSTSSGTEKDFAFAPGSTPQGVAVDPIYIRYALYDPTRAIRRGRLELFRRFDAKPIWALGLNAEHLHHGTHSIRWDGCLTGTIGRDPSNDKAEAKTEIPDGKTEVPDGRAEIDVEAKAETKATVEAIYKHAIQGDPRATRASLFPDGFVTAAESPYRLKITLEGDGQGQPVSAWTEFHVLIHSIELKLGMCDTLSQQRDRDLRYTLDDIPPKDNEIQEVYLTSNLFKMRKEEMYDNTLYTEYAKLWGDGPNIPLFANVYVRNSQGSKVTGSKEIEAASAVALGNVRFLWDYEDKCDMAACRGRAPVKTFIGDALDYGQAASRPQGGNCHQDRGGKRHERPAASGTTLARVFPEQKGEDADVGHKSGCFPFKVEQCANRNRYWAAISYAWTRGQLCGQTGVMFQPSRMAGDAYKVHVYLAYDRDKDGNPLLDADRAIDAEVKASTGTYQIWRKIHISSYYAKNGKLDNLFDTMAWFQTRTAFAEAFIKLECINKDACYLPDTTYHEAATRALKQHLGREKYDIFVPSSTEGAQPTLQPQEDCALQFNNYCQMMIKWYEKFDCKDSEKMNEWVENECKSKAQVSTGKINHALLYYRWLAEIAPQIVEATLNQLNLLGGPEEGVSIVQFSATHSKDHLQPLIMSGDEARTIQELAGVAYEFKGHTRSRCLIALFTHADATLAHEIGHQMMCPHAHGASEQTHGRDHSPQHHDQADTECLMSYNPKKSTFCGLCQLRLRGWDLTQLDPDGVKNKKQ